MAASFVNTVAANLLDYDDTHQATVIHPTAPVAPPVLALAERHGFCAAEVLAARHGLLAALFAQAGYDAAPDALEGRLGWARATGDVPDLEAMLGELDTRWEFATNTYKPYPSGIVLLGYDPAVVLRRDGGGAGLGAVFGLERIALGGPAWRHRSSSR